MRIPTIMLAYEMRVVRNGWPRPGGDYSQIYQDMTWAETRRRFASLLAASFLQPLRNPGCRRQFQYVPELNTEGWDPGFVELVIHNGTGNKNNGGSNDNDNKRSGRAVLFGPPPDDRKHVATLAVDPLITDAFVAWVTVRSWPYRRARPPLAEYMAEKDYLVGPLFEEAFKAIAEYEGGPAYKDFIAGGRPC